MVRWFYDFDELLQNTVLPIETYLDITKVEGCLVSRKGKPHFAFLNIPVIFHNWKLAPWTLESMIAETISHEVIHEILLREVSVKAYEDWDNIYRIQEDCVLEVSLEKLKRYLHEIRKE